MEGDVRIEMLLLLMVKGTLRGFLKFSINQRKYNINGEKTTWILCIKFTKHMIGIIQYLSYFYFYSWGYVCDQMQSPGTLLTLGEVVCHNLNSSYSLTYIRRGYSIFDSGECGF